MSALRPVLEAENRLVRFNADRDRIVGEVERRIIGDLVEAAEAGGDASLEYVLNDVAYAELKRLSGRKDRSGQKQAQRWRELATHLGRMSEREKRDRLAGLIRYYAGDVVGNFNPKVFRFANDLLPPALGLLFTPVSSWRSGIAAIRGMSGRIQVEGEVDLVRRCCDRGTVVVTPTHSSNMDSIAVGFGLSQSGLPPMTYGAGKNLFSNPLISFFMHNLGAYRVDRRLRFALYKEVLKEYSTVLLESGYHSLFFPGGTRSRSNIVESHLKLGLLGTAVAAYRNNVAKEAPGVSTARTATGAPERRIYIVPVTINYRLVLEAETLIEDHLAEQGKSQYIITDDEFSRVGRILDFMRKTMAHEGAVVLRFGRPRDPFGNVVDDDCQPVDGSGRRLESSRYLTGADGLVSRDMQREAQYTRILGAAIAADYRRETVFLSTSLVARAIYDAVADHCGTTDIYRLVRLTTAATAVDLSGVLGRLDQLRDAIAADASVGVVPERERAMSAEELLDDALRAFGTYHTRSVARRVGDRVRVGYMKLLYYYQNRTRHVVMASGSDAGAADAEGTVGAS